MPTAPTIPESAKTIDPTAFLTGNPNDFIDVEEDTKENKQDVVPEQKKEVKKDPPAKELKHQYEKTKKELEELRSKYEQYEAKVKELEELDPLKPVAEYVKKKAGKIDQDTVNEYIIKKGSERKKALSEFEQKLKLKDQQVKELNIEQSQEWQEDYIAPINKARDTLIASIVNFDNDGKVKHNPAIYQELFSELISVDKDGRAKTPTEMRAAIRKFEASYAKATDGDEYDAPSLREVQDAVASFHSSVSKAQKAKSEWDSLLQERQKEKAYEEAKKQEALHKREVEGRDFLYEKYKNSLSLKELDGIIDPNDFISAAEEEHQYLSSLMLRKEGIKPRAYEQFIDLAARGKMFDALVEKYKEIQAELEQFKKDQKSGSPRIGSPRTEQKQITIDPTNPNYNPTGFLD